MSDGMAQLRAGGQVYEIDLPVNDPESDAAARINDAFNRGSLSGGCSVILAPGTYWCRRTITIPANSELVIPTGCTLMLAPGANCDVVSANSAARVRVSGGGVIDGNRANQTSAGNGVSLTNCPDARLQVTVQNCYGDGISLTGCARPVLDVAANSNGRHGVYLAATAFASGNLVAINNGQRVAGNGLTLDAASTDASINLTATDTQTTKSQQYGVLEVAASGCDRNLISGSLNGNAAGTASLVGTSSKVVALVAQVASGVNPQPVGTTASPGSATQATPVDHVHVLGPGAVTSAALAADVPRVNLLTNGGFEVWQRGVGPFTANSAYTADRWQILLGGTSTISVTQETTVIDVNGTAALKAVYVQGTANSQIDQKLENYQQLRGKTLSFSVRVRQGVASNVRPYISDSGTKTYGTASAITGSYVTLTVTLAIGTASTGVNVGIDLGASDTVYIDNAMLVVGSVRCDYVPLHPADEMTRCERYYEVIGGNIPNQLLGTGLNHSTTAAALLVLWQVLKPVSPTVTVTNPTNLQVVIPGDVVAVTSASATHASNRSVEIGVSVASGLTTGQAAILRGDATTNAQIVVEANP